MEEKIFFKSSNGLKLCGIISKPEVEQKLPCVILCHGYDTLKNNTTNKKLFKKLLENNIGSLRFDFRGHGESEGSMRTLTLTKTIDDLQSALKYVKSLNWIDQKRIGILGNSFSGVASTLVTSKNQEVKALVLLSAVSYYPEVKKIQLGKEGIQKWKKDGFMYLPGFERKVKMDYAFYEDSLKYRSYDFADRIRAAVLMVHDDRDKEVPIGQAKKLFNSLKCEKKLEIIRGIGHGFERNEESYDRMTHVIANWFNKWLK